MAGFRALFLAYDSANTQRPWVTDGTDAGTFPLSVPGLSGKRCRASSSNGAEHCFNVRAPAAKHLRIVSPGAIPEQVCPGAAGGLA